MMGKFFANHTLTKGLNLKPNLRIRVGESLNSILEVIFVKYFHTFISSHIFVITYCDSHKIKYLNLIRKNNKLCPNNTDLLFVW